MGQSYAGRDECESVGGEDSFIPEQEDMSLDTTGRERAEGSMKESESRFRSYFDLGLIGMAVTSPIKGWTEVNERLCDILGYPRDELVTKTWAELTHPDDLAADVKQFDRVLCGEIEGYSLEKRFIRKDGQIIDAAIDVKCIRKEDHSVDQFVALIQDISARKRAEKDLQQAHDDLEVRVEERTAALRESEQRFRSIFEQAAVGIAVLETSTGHFVSANEMYCNLLGCSMDEITHKTFQGVTHPDDLQEDLDNMHRLVNGEIREFTMEKRYYRKDGSLVWVNLTVSPLWDPGEEPLQHIAIAEDISVRKQAEAELKADQTLLRRLINLQEQERRIVAHDIHDGFVQDVVGAHFRVQRIHPGLDQKKLQEIVDDVASLLAKAIAEGRRMIRDLRPMVLDEQGIVEAVRHLIADEQKHGDLIIAFEDDVQFDRLEPRLEGVIFRIVQEALNNVKRHGQTDHAAVQLTQRDGQLEVVVRDQGVGFDPDKVTTENFGLRGICERARLFGGAARVESSPGAGTTVYVQLPIVTAPPPSEAA